jgi:hypothetical protein
MIGARIINDFKGIAQKLLRLQDGIWQIGGVAFGLKIGSIPVAPTIHINDLGHRMFRPSLVAIGNDSAMPA